MTLALPSGRALLKVSSRAPILSQRYQVYSLEIANFLRDSKVMVRFDPLRSGFSPYGLCSIATAPGGGHMEHLAALPGQVRKRWDYGVSEQPLGTTVSCDGINCLLLTTQLMVGSGVICVKPSPPIGMFHAGSFLGTGQTWD